MSETEGCYCGECLYYDNETEQGINGEKMATCDRNHCLVNKNDEACEDFAC